ncbi:MAG TPA: hypothetical protein VLR45_05405 [Desulfoprunum sp.]|nr:hypothetical protein [Desulfoprunum sp.]
MTVDDRPWFQPLSFSLGAFLATPQSEVSFWMIRSDNLEVVAMQAAKGEVEEITVAGRKPVPEGRNQAPGYPGGAVAGRVLVQRG